MTEKAISVVYRKRINTLPHGPSGIIYNENSLPKACKNGDSAVDPNVSVYTSAQHIPKWQNNAGNHVLDSQPSGGLTNIEGLFSRNETKMTYKVSTSQNQSYWPKTFLVGQENVSSWLCNVCGLWGVVDAKESEGKNDPNGYITQIIGAYKSPSGVTYHVPYTVKKGDYEYGRWLSPSNTAQYFGFLASSSDAEKIMNDKWMLFGYYIEVGVVRNGKGTYTDTCAVSLSCLTPQIKKTYITWTGGNTKMLIVPKRRHWYDAQKPYKIILNHT